MLPDGSRLHVMTPQITRRHMDQPVVRPGPYIETLSPGMAGHRFSPLGRADYPDLRAMVSPAKLQDLCHNGGSRPSGGS